jgi:hypothetical protein
VFRAEAQLDEAERRSYAHYRSWRRAHALAAARIVDDLLAGARPRPTDLVQLRGDELQERVRVGYKPFFAGDWSCNPEDGYRSFIESVAYEGESRSKRLGSFGYEIDERGLDAAALIQIDGASGRQELRLVESSSSIAVAGAGPAAKRVYCRPFGEEREHATPPPREALALNMLGRVRGFGLKGKLTSEPDPEWAEGRDTSIALDDAFAFEMGLASLPPRVWFLTTILGDGRVTHVYRVERDASWGIDSDFRRVETRFDDGEMQALVQALREERFFHQPLSIRNQSIVDGGYATLRLHTRSGSKVVTLENALPESMRKVMQLVATYLDARPGLGEQSTATGHLYHTLPERHVTATLRPDYVNDRDASVEVELVNVSEGGKVIGNSEGVWRASLDHFNPVELSVPVSAHEAIDPRQRYEMRARIVDGDRVLVGRAPAITDGRGQTADIALTGLMR